MEIILGGQKQRISFIQVLIKDSPILVWNEPTASMDQEFELEFVNRLLDHSADKTVFFIVHNTGLLQLFDKTLYFETNTIWNSIYKKSIKAFFNVEQ